MSKDLTDKINLINQKRKDSHTKGKKGINGSLEERVKNIEIYLGWRKEAY